MRIDIAIIDKYLINKNKQFHQFDETAHAYYLIVFDEVGEKVVVVS